MKINKKIAALVLSATILVGAGTAGGLAATSGGKPANVPQQQTDSLRLEVKRTPALKLEESKPAPKQKAPKQKQQAPVQQAPKQQAPKQQAPKETYYKPKPGEKESPNGRWTKTKDGWKKIDRAPTSGETQRDWLEKQGLLD